MKHKTTTQPDVQIRTNPTVYKPPKSELESLARCLYPAIVSYFESESGQREFAEWKARQNNPKARSDL